MNPRIFVLGTGGTISCTHDSRGDLIPTLSTQDLVDQAGLTNITARDILQLESSSITLHHIDCILAAIMHAHQEGADRVVVLHGTDTMEETAMAADRLLPPDVCVTFTGAQRPADDPHPDGPDNLAFAARCNEPLPCIAFNDEIIPAYGATKVHTSQDAAFASSLSTPASEVRPPAHSWGDAIPQLDGLTVDIVPAYAGADASLIKRGADGYVIEALGSGNVPAAMEASLRSLDVPWVVCSRVPFGGVSFTYGGSGGGAELASIGARSGGELRPSQARMQLLCELAARRSREAGED